MEEFAFFAPAHNPPYVAAMRCSPGRAGRSCPSSRRPSSTASTGGDDLRAVRLARGAGCAPSDFHGTSHRAANEHVQAPRRRPPAHLHLGGSSSLAAVRDGVAADTSFGMSPQSACQSNRCGDLDVFAALRHEEARPRPRRDGARAGVAAGPRASAACLATSATSTNSRVGNARARPPSTPSFARSATPGRAFLSRSAG